MLYKDFKDIRLSALGMGNMRLPQTEANNPNAPIDWVEAHKIIDRAYEAGINYFDTAYVYNAGESEKCLGACMKKHPRDTFYLATKFYIDANPDYKAVFEEQLERLETDHIDFYLLHCLMDSNIDNYLNSGAIDYFLKMKEEGKIRYLGFSSHASVETLERFASHHDWDFAQIQLNYYDWLYSTTKQEYEILEKHGIKTMVMEPVRGGRLSALSEDADALLKSVHPEWSISSWALRFVQSLPNVQVILSGMSTMDQMEDNLKTFSSECSLSEEDKEIAFKAAEMFRSKLVVPCTGCCYCTEGCPMGINIPEWLKIYNAFKSDGSFIGKPMADAMEGPGPDDCIECGNCTGHCPQGIDTPKVMKELVELIK
ncbi:MAG: aldo/keto reductase [Erysipelotrichaceae bacterium]|nr:aldo/keto reductase [Erysipelotrichaceae bacterium]